MTPLRFAVVGSGHMAAVMIGAMRATEGVAVSAVVSRSADRAAAFAADHGIAASYADIDGALADPAVDAVYIAGKSAGHAAAAQAALAAGKPVLCEKPLAVTAAEAEAIVAAARRHGTLLMEAIATPFVPAVSAALAAAAGGDLGELRHVEASFGYPASPQSHPGCWHPTGGGVLLDRMVYLVTLARLTLGPIASIASSIVRDEAGIDVDATLLTRHGNGGTATLAASLTTTLANSLTVAGTRGTAAVQAPLLTAEWLRIGQHAAPTRPAPDGGLRRTLASRPLLRRMRGMVAAPLAGRFIGYGTSPYGGELAHFRDLYRAGAKESPLLPPSLSLEVARILDEARNANR